MTHSCKYRDFRGKLLSLSKLFAKMKSSKLKIALFVLLAGLVSVSCTERPRFIQISGYAQGGTYSVRLNMTGVKIQPVLIQEAVDSILTLVDTTLSGYNKGSMLSRFNRGETVRPNALFRDIYNVSRKWFEQSEGALDMAAGPLFDAWGFGFTTDSMPSRDKISTVLGECGMRRLKPVMEPDADGLLAPSALLAGEGALPQLNYNAIAQGYTCDLVASYLQGIGVRDMLVDIGEIYCAGTNPGGRPWSVGVDRPEDGNVVPGQSMEGVWDSGGMPVGIVTSGNYRKFYVRDGRKYAHTLDPRTGWPVQHNLLSATIVAPEAATADALATWCMVVGLDRARELIMERPDTEGCLIYDEDGEMKTWTSDGFTLH